MMIYLTNETFNQTEKYLDTQTQTSNSNQVFLSTSTNSQSKIPVY